MAASELHSSGDRRRILGGFTAVIGGSMGAGRGPVGIPVKLNANSEGKPNGIPG